MSVVYGPNGGPSARALANSLSIPAIRLAHVHDPMVGAHVNWTGGPMDGILNGLTETHKLRQLERWAHAGIACLQHSTEYVVGWMPRSNFHWGGRDFTMRQTHDFYTQPMRSVKEWRVHVFRKPGGTRGNPGDYVVGRVGWKVNVEPNLNRDWHGTQIRNRRTGWRLQHYAEPRPVAARDTLSKWAIAIQGWDFGCVDVLQTEGPEQFVLLEGNSCPSLKDAATLACYKRHVGALLNT